MVNKTSESTKNEVIRLHVLGCSNTQIAQDTATSTGNVSNIINEFKGRIDSGDYQNIRTLANLCIKNNIKPSEVLEGLATYRLLEKNNIDANGFEKLVQAIL